MIFTVLRTVRLGVVEREFVDFLVVDLLAVLGATVVAVDFGYTDTPMSQLGPDHIISHFDDLWDAVERLSPALAR